MRVSNKMNNNNKNNEKEWEITMQTMLVTNTSHVAHRSHVALG